jgi:hypothetical protein
MFCVAKTWPRNVNRVKRRSDDGVRLFLFCTAPIASPRTPVTRGCTRGGGGATRFIMAADSAMSSRLFKIVLLASRCGRSFSLCWFGVGIVLITIGSRCGVPPGAFAITALVVFRTSIRQRRRSSTMAGSSSRLTPRSFFSFLRQPSRSGRAYSLFRRERSPQPLKGSRMAYLSI